MAQLKDTTINGGLSVSGNISSSKTPTISSHVATKGYVDGIGIVYQKDFVPIGNNYNASGQWYNFTSDSFDISLEKGTYIITYTVNATAGGSGVLTSQMTSDGSELELNISTRTSGACSTSTWTALNNTFVLSVNSKTSYSFKPRVYGNVYWTGRTCRMSIVKITA